MFQLIVAVVALALVVLMALAMLWFGGSAFSSGADRALYAQLMNHGSQIEGALKLYSVDRGTFPSGTSSEQFLALTSLSQGATYLKDVPQGEWYINEGTIYRSLNNIDQCSRVNYVAKKDLSLASAYDGCPPCNGVAGGAWEQFKDWPGCRRDPLN